MGDTPQRRSGYAEKLGFVFLAVTVCWLMARHSPSPRTEGGDLMDHTRYSDTGINQPPQRSGSHAAPLWFVFLAGPVLWVIDLMLGYLIAAIGCNANFSGATLLGHLLTLACALGTAFAGYVAVKQWRRSQVDELTVANGGGGSRTFMELAGILMSAYFLLLIIGEDIALFVLKPCQSIT